MAESPLRPSIRSLLSRRFDPAELRAIKRLWVGHSLAEDARDIDDLVATIAPRGEDPETQLFTGEKIWFDASALDQSLGRSG